MTTGFRALLALVCLFGTNAAVASTGELYGYGSRASALGNTMLGGTTEPFATFYNPAANSTHPGLQVSLGIDFAHPSFTDIHGITIANSATSSKSEDIIGDVVTDNYEDQLGQMVGVSFNLGEQFKNLTAGATAFLPLTHIGYLDSGDPFLPEYLSYRSRTQRPQIYASLSATPIKHLSLAMGIAIATNLSASTNAYLTKTDNSFSHQQFASTIKPGAAPYFSLYADPDPIQIGGTIRLPNRYKISLDVNADAGLLGNAASLPLALNSSSTLYYDPLEIDAAVGYKLTPELWVTVEADWLQYKAFEPPTFSVTQLPTSIQLNNSISTAPGLQNIIIPKAAFSYDLSESTILRGGYMYRPSPITDNSGPGNLVDPARHSITAGLGFNLKKLHIVEKEIFLDIDAQYHYLVSQHITKTPNNEAGVSGQTKVGAPGYDIGGHIYGGGFSLSMAF